MGQDLPLEKHETQTPELRCAPSTVCPVQTTVDSGAREAPQAKCLAPLPCHPPLPPGHMAAQPETTFPSFPPSEVGPWD